MGTLVAVDIAEEGANLRIGLLGCHALRRIGDEVAVDQAGFECVGQPIDPSGDALGGGSVAVKGGLAVGCKL
ncbi:hypothetical protein EBB59_10965 [Lysobacter pythonis]|uniref:Uncharacterized protein n=1 Tax=Solilutibacter pythonis TaxID=2483112 RepID=A0A3M2HS32_9GAMM|nr:hypothetical protein EBB59_10965 [Lysobacter pythonis]